ncbi:MAG: ATP-dependent 6-phosphofructokinase [Desulfovibrio sp.]|jgi:6-phosphofructokinase 1
MAEASLSGNVVTEVRTRLLGEPAMPSPIPSDVAGTGGRVELDLGSGVLSSSGEHGRFSFELAGAKDRIFFDPFRSRCAIVTCGGLCPGINDVIQSIVLSAFHSYGIPSVIGIRYGLKGFLPSLGLDHVELTPSGVQHIHESGGTILGTSRGPQPPEAVVDSLLEKGVDMLFMIGGDGTMKAALDIHREVLRRQARIAVVGIPKTIDNDINFVPQSFGFVTAVEKASEAIRCASVEARSVMGGVGLVRLMGRESGFIAASSALSARETDFVLIPESRFALEGEDGLLASLERRLERQRHAVIVLAEGSGQDLLEETHRTDVSGNRQLADISSFLLERFSSYFRSIGKAYYPKFFDPGYLIRATPANASDRQYCGNLGQNAVHAAMSGHAGMVVARIMDCFVHLPLELVTAKRRTLNTQSTLWRSVLEMTGQGDLGGARD